MLDATREASPPSRLSRPSRCEAATRSPVTPTLRVPTSGNRYTGLWASIAVHLLLLAVLVSHGDRLWSRTLAPGDAALRGGSSARGGGGGNRVAYITLPSLPAEAQATVKTPAPPQDRPPKVVAAVKPAPAPAVSPPAEIVDTAVSETGGEAAGSSVAGTDPGRGAGPAGGGVGQGSGADSGSGSGGGRARPPEPRDMAFPFDNPPKELRGVSLSVTFWVRVDGRVERYEVVPEIRDREYAKKFDEVMRAFRFTPARAPDGSQVAGTTKISFTLPGKSSS
jgi:hypothetical protein